MINAMMSREIAVQAELLPRCVASIAAQTTDIVLPKGRIFAGGCGDCAFAPGALGDFFTALGIDVNAATSMTLASFTRFKPDDTVILSSISGETKRTVEAAEAARSAGGRVIAITCGKDSALARAAHHTIVLPFTPLSRKTPHTLDYSVTLLALAQLTLSWAGQASDTLLPSPTVLSRMIETAASEAGAIVEALAPGGKVFFLGAGPDLASAEYGAAKFHEAGGLIAIAAETENFVHGMNFMIEPQDTILALGGNGPGLSRGRTIVDGYSDFVACTGVIGADEQSGGSGRRAFLCVLRTTFVLQHLCLAVAERLGLQVESPRAGRPDGQRHADIQSGIMRK
jgi:fructoselysine-6-P-deglycase FrlB-like protein